jgi:hypothetical protein
MRLASCAAPEVLMLMPAIAFSWWLMSQPMGAARATPPRLTDDTVAAALGPESDPSADVARENAASSAGAGDTSDNSVDRVLYRGIITPDIARIARSFLDLPMGAERFADIDGQRFVFVLQRHYHPPGFVGAPTGWHKGVTVFTLR